MMCTGPSIFVCTECGKGFCRKADYTRHVLIHDPDAERFHCSYPGCTHSSLQKSNLKTHYISKHLHLRNHRCCFYGCDKKYSDASALIRHEKLVHGFFRRAHKPYARTSVKKIEPQTDQAELELLALVNATAPMLNGPSTDLVSRTSTAFPSTPSFFDVPLPGPPSFSWSNTFEPQAQSMDTFLHEMVPDLFPDPKFAGNYENLSVIPDMNAHQALSYTASLASFPQYTASITSSVGFMDPSIPQLY